MCIRDRLGAILRAQGLYYGDREAWNRLVKKALNEDFSWSVSAAKYKELYKSIL